MEQLHVPVTGDSEKMHKIIDELMKQDKEFQIMITVSSSEKSGGSGEKEVEVKWSGESALKAASLPAGVTSAMAETEAAPVFDLETDVTDMIHDGAGYGDVKFHHKTSLPVHRKQIPDYAQQSGAGHPPCHRSRLEQGEDGNTGRTFWVYHKHRKG